MIFNKNNIFLFVIRLLTVTILLSKIEILASKPVVLLHGLESNAANLDELSDWIQEKFNRVTFNIELGNGDKYSSSTPIYTQIEELKVTIENIALLSDGFDFIGISQGGLIGRGYVEKYNQKYNQNINNTFAVENLITLVSPHGGVYDKFLSFIDMYKEKNQLTMSFSNYWRDPTNILTYLVASTFLADANNEKNNKNELYKINIETLKNFVMVYSPNDEIIKPPESGIFSFYNDKLEIVDLFSSDLYKEDWIGLLHLDKLKKLHMYNTNCTHVEHRKPICFPQLYEILKLYL